MSSIFYNLRARKILLQCVLIGALAGLFAWLFGNAATNLANRGITGGFDFLQRAARFPISESILSYTPSDTFAWAFVVGLVNTLGVALAVAVMTTILGSLIALVRRSSNPLARMWGISYVEAFRSTPLVVQLLFWYALLTVGLPGLRDALQPLPGTFLLDRGLYLSVPAFNPSAMLSLGLVLVGTVLMFLHPGRRLDSGARRRSRGLRRAIGVALVIAAAALAAIRGQIQWDVPTLGRYNYSGGLELSPELSALLLGLTLYTASFVAEIVRGGIEAVDRGQWEAGRAIGLSERTILRFVVVPQALKVIVPPMISQYVNVIKNTTLALAVGYPDLALVTATTINQTGQALEGIFILILIFVTLSASASFLLNMYNRRVMGETR